MSRQLRAGPRMFGDEMARALERRTVDPPRGEAQRVERRTQGIGNPSNAREVHRAAVDVDDALEQREGVAVVDIHRANHRAFCG